jgi:hypothetical protein
VETGNPVALVRVALLGVPSAGVTSVGLVANTKAPEPVSSLITPANSDEVVAASADSLSVVTTKVLLDGIVVLLILVAVATPKLGVVKLGLVANTSAPEPVSSLMTPANCADVVAANWDKLPDVRALVSISVCSSLRAACTSVAARLPDATLEIALASWASVVSPKWSDRLVAVALVSMSVCNSASAALSSVAARLPLAAVVIVLLAAAIVLLVTVCVLVLVKIS